MEKYLSLKEWANREKISYQWAYKLAKGKKISGCRWEPVFGRYFVPTDSKRQKKVTVTVIIPPDGYITLESWCRREGLTRVNAYISIGKGHIPGARKIDGHWMIPVGAKRIRKPKKARKA